VSLNDTLSHNPSVETHTKLERFLTEHFLLAFWLGLFAGVFSFYVVLILTSIVADSFRVLSNSRLFEVPLVLIAAVAGTYVCARVAKETPLFATACLGVSLAFFMFIGFIFSMGTPDWFFYLCGTSALVGSLIGYVSAIPEALMHIRIWLKRWHDNFTTVALVCLAVLVFAVILVALLFLLIYALSSFA
jgi:hypothetical protein